MFELLFAEGLILPVGILFFVVYKLARLPFKQAGSRTEYLPAYILTFILGVIYLIWSLAWVEY